MENFIFCAVSRVFRFSLSKVINICFHGYLNIVCNKSAKKAGMVISNLAVLYMLHVWNLNWLHHACKCPNSQVFNVEKLTMPLQHLFKAQKLLYLHAKLPRNAQEFNLWKETEVIITALCYSKNMDILGYSKQIQFDEFLKENWNGKSNT